MFLFYLVAGSVIFLDRITKYAALRYVSKQALHLFPGASLNLVFNTGVSFGFFSSSGANSHFMLTFLVAVIVALLIIVWRHCSSHTLQSTLGYGCIIGGAISNFYDRLFFGSVIDFIDLYAGRWHFPTFNIADVAISLGFLVLMWETLHANE